MQTFKEWLNEAEDVMQQITYQTGKPFYVYQPPEDQKLQNDRSVRIRSAMVINRGTNRVVAHSLDVQDASRLSRALNLDPAKAEAIIGEFVPQWKSGHPNASHLMASTQPHRSDYTNNPWDHQ